MRRVDTQELLDTGNHPPALLAENLADMALATRWLGGAWLLRGALAALLRAVPPGPLTLLDVGCGGGVAGLTAADWARQAGYTPTLLGADLSPPIVQIAAANAQLLPLVADGRTLPLGAGAVDIALCSFTIHHLPPSAAIKLLRELRRVAVRGVVLDDLLRSPANYVGAWLFSHALSANSLTRHDGSLSVRRAYTLRELRALAASAGLALTHTRSLGYRGVLALK